MESFSHFSSNSYERVRTTLFIPLLLLLGSASAGSTVYRCLADDGSIEFRSYSCDSGTGEEIEIETAPTGWIKPDTQGPPVSEKSKSEKKRKKAKTAIKAKSQDRACWKARQRLERMQWELRKGYQPGKGERLRQRRREQEAYLREFCN